MANDPITLDFTGNLVAEPALKFTPNGSALADFTVISNSGYRNDAGEWVDRDPVSLRCTIWGEQAERVAGLAKGDRVAVKGRLDADNYEVDGQKRYGFKVHVFEVAPSMLNADVVVTRIKREQPASA